MSVNKVNIEIDGKKVQADQGAMIIEAADNSGAYIPRFCYHKKLSVAANCRMCLIEIEGMRKAVPACATPISEGMKVRTRSELARKSQKAVMEFLLINHPLDCPVCDQGGECELQDLAMGYGAGQSRYDDKKRVVHDKNLGPLINTEMTRCIYCTRCVRFLTEIAGQPELGMIGRGEHVEVTTYIEHSIESEVSGNVIDLCPVGALTSKPFLFTARPWELKQQAGVAAHDCLGSNINLHFVDQKIKRVVPKENEQINEAWLSDRDRFSYDGVNSVERLQKPLLKRGDKWEELDWNTALEIVASSFENVRNAYGARDVAGLISMNATLEEQYLFQKLLRAFGSDNVDHRYRQMDFSYDEHAPSYPGMELPIAELANCDRVLLIGSDIQREQPLAALRLIKASKNGAAIMLLNGYDYAFRFKTDSKIISAPQQFVHQLAGILKAITLQKPVEAAITNALLDLPVSETAKVMAEKLLSGKKVTILIGAAAQNHPEAQTIIKLARALANLTDGTFGILTQGANAAGAWLAGCIPHRTVAHTPIAKSGLNAQTMFLKPCKAYALFNLEPEYDCANPHLVLTALRQADFVVSFSPFVTPAIREYSDIILPIAPFTETAGTFVNCNGIWQSFNNAVQPLAETKPGWKVLRVLGNFLDLPEFDYSHLEQIRGEVKQAVDAMNNVPAPSTVLPIIKMSASGLMRYSDWLLYREDNVVRRSRPLQESIDISHYDIHIASSLAAKLNFQAGDAAIAKQGNVEYEANIVIDDAVPNDTVYIAAGTDISAYLGAAFGPVELTKMVE
jgi:NADH-quinone oxidoreductase subunit G